MSADGTMIAVPHLDSPQPAADSSAIAGASDTESNSERDHEVWRHTLSQMLGCFCMCFRGLVFFQVYHTESEAARSRLSSVSSVSIWNANSDWVRIVYCLFSYVWCFVSSAFSVFYLFSGVIMEEQTSSTDDYEAAASSGPSGGEDLH